mgnify:CR=1 FL=1
MLLSLFTSTTWLQLTSMVSYDDAKNWWKSKLNLCVLMSCMHSALVISNESQLFFPLFNLNLYFIWLYFHLKATRWIQNKWMNVCGYIVYFLFLFFCGSISLLNSFLQKKSIFPHFFPLLKNISVIKHWLESACSKNKNKVT